MEKAFDYESRQGEKTNRYSCNPSPLSLPLLFAYFHKFREICQVFDHCLPAFGFFPLCYSVPCNLLVQQRLLLSVHSASFLAAVFILLFLFKVPLFSQYRLKLSSRPLSCAVTKVQEFFFGEQNQENKNLFVRELFIYKNTKIQTTLLRDGRCV